METNDKQIKAYIVRNRNNDLLLVALMAVALRQEHHPHYALALGVLVAVLYILRLWTE